MTAHVLRYRLRHQSLDDPRWWLLLAAVAGWSALVVSAALGWVAVPYALPIAAVVPLGLGGALAFHRGHAPVPLRLAAGWSSIVFGALAAAFLIGLEPRIALVVPGLLVTTLACLRYPAAAIVAVFVLTASYGSLDAFLSFPVGETVDLLLAALWLGVVWSFAVRRPRRSLWLWPGVVAVSIYLILTMTEVLWASSISIGLHSFRASSWYIMAFLLIGFAGLRQTTNDRITRGLVVVAMLVGAYAILRLIVGPAGPERELAEVSTHTNFVTADEEDIGLVGSLTSRHELSAWVGLAIPFCFALALAWRGRRRLLAVTAAGACTAAMLGTEVRVALVAAVVGTAVALALYQAARAFRGLHLGTTAVALGGALAVGAVVFSLTVGPTDRAERYSAIFDPSEDAAYRDRVDKWRMAIREIETHPFGHGAGTAGRVQERYGRQVTIASYDIDNSYLKVAYEQGWFVMVLFVAALLLLLIGLARRAVLTLEEARAGPAIGACGVLAGLLVLFMAGVYIEGLPALAGWVMIGVGFSQFAWVETRGGETAAGSQPSART